MKVRFFARLREQLGSEYLELADEDCPPSVGRLRSLLADRVATELGAALADPNVLCAVNQQIVGNDATLSCEDEVAFFPPVTGG